MLALLIILVFIGTFLAAAVAVCITALIQYRRNNAAVLDDLTPDGSVPLLLRQQPVSSVPFWQQLLDSLNFTAGLKRKIDDAGLHWSVGRVSLAMLLLAALAFAVLVDAAWAPPGASLAAAWAGGSIPYWIIEHKRKQRLRKMEGQF